MPAGGLQTHNLPTELLDMILEETALETRKACSLVCRGWLDLSRTHLFKVIVVRADATFDAFLCFLRAHPHISIHIRKICLYGPLGSGKPEAECPRVDPGTLVDISLCTPNVSYIELQAIL
ncbi:hypothetical protein K466DRAFT_661882 [Polyporus arcularius HHB13444]|uniref:F-box domain-containing protein n=1 Tax=Polyporus arcularius HHB13444 TaxID=1314778 RepID=A0A5C3PL47_9APHY|nr:hypothetical protein K466DRAFT_661882 [Polyporus arcularius HHB13444]